MKKITFSLMILFAFIASPLWGQEGKRPAPLPGVKTTTPVKQGLKIKVEKAEQIKQVVAMYENYCLEGFHYGFPTEESIKEPWSHYNAICKSHIGGTIEKDGIKKTISNVYVCAVGENILADSCPQTSKIYTGDFMNIATQYICKKDSPFGSAEIKCSEGFEICNPDDFSEAVSQKPNGCANWAYMDDPNCLPDMKYPEKAEGFPGGGSCCTKKDWQYNCCMPDSYKKFEGVKSDKICVSPAMTLGGYPDGVCCAFLK